MIYIVKSSDQRYFHLYELLRRDKECEYSNKFPLKNNIKVLVLPIEGIDEFGYIKHTSINLENLLSVNKVEVIFTGKVNNLLRRLCQLNNIKLYSFYDDIKYQKGEEMLKMDVIKAFLEEKLNTKFCDINILMLYDEKINPVLILFNNNLYKSNEFEYVDAIINFSNKNLNIFKDKIIIEMNEIENLDLSILLNCKKIYLINQLMYQYLTKSGGKLLYDSMVNR